MGVTRLVTLILGAVLVVAGFSAFFTVNQTQQALVLQFGEPKRTIQEPGLAQDAVRSGRNLLPERVLNLIPQDAEEVILSDQASSGGCLCATLKIHCCSTRPFAMKGLAEGEAIIDSSVRRALGRETWPRSGRSAE